MNWSSVKNLLIAILVAANLFLIFNIVRQDRTRAYIPENELHDAVMLLDERGYSVNDGAVPLKKFKAPVYESLYSDEYYTEVATALSESEREMLYTLPGGGISISAKNGASMEFDNEFDFRYTEFDNQGSTAYTEITADTFAEFSAAGTVPGAAKLKALSSDAVEFLCRLQPKDSPLTAKVADVFTDGDGYTYILAEQYLGEYRVYSHYAVCVFDDAGLIAAYGRWYFAQTDKNYTTELHDQINILFTDMATLKSTSVSMLDSEDGSISDTTEPEANAYLALPAVSRVTPCYAVYWNSNKTALYFIPAWQIEHVDSFTVVYNATNGTIYSASK